MVEPVTMICAAAFGLAAKALASTPGQAVVGGIIGNRADALFVKLLDAIGGPFIAKFRNGQNSDLLDGLLAAYQKSLTDTVEECGESATTSTEKRITKRLKHLDKIEQKAGVDAAVDFMPIAQPLIAREMQGVSHDQFNHLIATARASLIADLESRMGEAMPDSFKAIFTAKWEGHFQRHLIQLLKSKEGEGFQKIFVAGSVSEILGYAVTIDKLTQAMSGKLDDIDATTKETSEDVKDIKDMVQILVGQAQSSTEGRKAEANGVTLDAFIALARTINAHVTQPEHALAELKAALVRLSEAQSSAGNNLDDRLKRVLRDIQDRRLLGQFDEAVSIGDTAYDEWLDQQAKAQQEGVNLIKAQITSHLLRQDALSAAIWIERRLSAESGTNEPIRERLKDEIIFWTSSGRKTGSNIDLSVAIALARNLLTRSNSEELKVDSHQLLGNALYALGERSKDTSVLIDSKNEYDEAFKLVNFDQDPVQWAITRLSQANIAQKLGERDGDVQKLNTAAEWIQSALRIFEKYGQWNDWADAQVNLATVLYSIGDIERDIKVIRKSIDSCRSALMIITKESNPEVWARTQLTLGTALQKTGRYENSAEIYQESVSAYGLALTVRTRESAARSWAGTQINLGISLLQIGKIRRNLALVEQSVEALTLALEELSESDAPNEWALATAHLGDATACKGVVTSNASLLNQAEAMLLEAARVAESCNNQVLLHFSRMTLRHYIKDKH